MGVETTAGYELLYDIIRRRSSIRKLSRIRFRGIHPQDLGGGAVGDVRANLQPWDISWSRIPR